MEYGELLREAAEIKPELVRIRRDLHMHPELGHKEERTVSLVQGTLESLGIKTKRVAGTGLMGVLEGKGRGRTVALRADMDALPMQDGKKTPYASAYQGKMHACGHDVHTAGLLGAAMLLSQRRNQFAGSVKFFFQPAEETDGGAWLMIKDGVMEGPKVDAVFGLHVAPDLDVGMIAVRAGQFYAACDMLDVVIRGKESHGASPNKGVDAIVVGSQVVSALQSFVSRNVSPLDAAVVTIGKFNGGYQRNIVADKVELSGIIRTLNPKVRSRACRQLPELIKSVANAMGAVAEVEYKPDYPSLVNDERMTAFVQQSAAELLGESKVKVRQHPHLAGEDFAYFLQEAPGCFYELGVRNDAKGIDHPLHTQHFDVDEESLAVAAAMHAKLALDFLMK